MCWSTPSAPVPAASRTWTDADWERLLRTGGDGRGPVRAGGTAAPASSAVGPHRQCVGPLDPAPEPHPGGLHGVQGGHSPVCRRTCPSRWLPRDPRQHGEPGLDRHRQLQRGPSRGLRARGPRRHRPLRRHDAGSTSTSTSRPTWDAPASPRRWRRHRLPGLPHQRVRDRRQRQRRRRLGLRLMLDAASAGRDGRAPGPDSRRLRGDHLGGGLTGWWTRSMPRPPSRVGPEILGCDSGCCWPTAFASWTCSMRIRRSATRRSRAPLHHRPSPHRHHRPQQPAGRRPPDPLAPAVGILRPGATTRRRPPS
jgi:hypothetical protein